MVKFPSDDLSHDDQGQASSALKNEAFYSSFADSFLDFDALKEWIEEFPDNGKAAPESPQSETLCNCSGMNKTERCDYEGVLVCQVSGVNHLEVEDAPGCRRQSFSEDSVVEDSSLKGRCVEGQCEGALRSVVNIEVDPCKGSFMEGIIDDVNEWIEKISDNGKVSFENPQPETLENCPGMNKTERRAEGATECPAPGGNRLEVEDELGYHLESHVKDSVVEDGSLKGICVEGQCENGLRSVVNREVDPCKGSFMEGVIDDVNERIEKIPDNRKVSFENPQPETLENCSGMNKTERRDADGDDECPPPGGNCLKVEDELGHRPESHVKDSVVEDGSLKGICVEGQREDGLSSVVKIEEGPLAGSFVGGVTIDESDKLRDMGLSIEEQIGKVSLASVCDSTAVDDDAETGDASSSSSSSSSPPPSASSSGTDDDDSATDGGGGDNDDVKEKVTVGGDIEEGEILDCEADEMVGWSEGEDVNDGVGGNNFKGAIRSKNEPEVLPIVPPVNVKLQPYHETMPLGVILSIIGTQIIIEGTAKHSPLSEGSILWITESRSPLGFVDEIFGPVKNPYYKVRHNSENEVPNGIFEGMPVSFVSEFSKHVLNDSSVYMKGYDASDDNDEELLDDMEFSDDEKEAEYRRKLKISKRGNDDQRVGNRKNNRKRIKNRDTPRKNFPVNEGTDLTAAQAQGNCSRSSLGQGQGQGKVLGNGMGQASPFPQAFPQANTGFPGVIPGGIWANGCLPHQQYPMAGMLPVGLPPYGTMLHQGTPLQQMPAPNGMPLQFPQQFAQQNPAVGVFSQPNPNWVSGPVPVPCPQGQFGQVCSNPALGMGFHGQNPYLPLAAQSQMMGHGGQGFFPNRPQMGSGFNTPCAPPPIAGGHKKQGSHQFYRGVSSDMNKP